MPLSRRSFDPASDSRSETYRDGPGQHRGRQSVPANVHYISCKVIFVEPGVAKKIATDEIHKYYLRLDKTFDVDEVDSEFTVDLEDVKENVDSGNEPAQ